MINEPERTRRVFDCVATTMVDGARRLYDYQRQTGVVTCCHSIVCPDFPFNCTHRFRRGAAVRSTSWTAESQPRLA
jgi:hypothetical protein